MIKVDKVAAMPRRDLERSSGMLHGELHEPRNLSLNPGLLTLLRIHEIWEN